MKLFGLLGLDRLSTKVGEKLDVLLTIEDRNRSSSISFVRKTRKNR